MVRRNMVRWRVQVRHQSRSCTILREVRALRCEVQHMRQPVTDVNEVRKVPVAKTAQAEKDDKVKTPVLRGNALPEISQLSIEPAAAEMTPDTTNEAFENKEENTKPKQAVEYIEEDTKTKEAVEKKEDDIRMGSKPSLRRFLTTHGNEMDEHLDEHGAHPQKTYRAMLDPHSGLRVTWDLLSLFGLMYDVIMVPFMIAFDPPETTGATVMFYFLSFFWTLDIPLSFRTGFYEDGMLETNPRVVARRYLTSWFVLDLLVVSLDWVKILFGAVDSATRTLRVLKTARMARSLRLLRLTKITAVWNAIVDHANSKYLQLVSEGLRSIILILGITHFVSCAWFALSSRSAEDDDYSGWLSIPEYRDGGLLYQYFSAFHWALAQFTPISMEVRPHTVSERIFSVLCAAFGLGIFSSFISSVTSSITSARLLGRETSTQMHLVRQYLKQKHVSTSVNLRVTKYIEQVLEEKQSRLKEADVPALKLLSKSLWEELRYDEFSHTLLLHPFFEAMKTMDLHALKELCASGVICQECSIGDVLFTPGKANENMYFVVRGHLHYLGMASNEAEVLKKLSLTDGMWCSECALWSQWVHKGILVAKSSSEVLVINARKLDALAGQYSFTVGDLTSEYRNAFNKQLKEVQEDHLSDVSLGFSWTQLVSEIESEHVREALHGHLGKLERFRLDLLFTGGKAPVPKATRRNVTSSLDLQNKLSDWYKTSEHDVNLLRKCFDAWHGVVKPLSSCSQCTSPVHCNALEIELNPECGKDRRDGINPDDESSASVVAEEDFKIVPPSKPYPVTGQHLVMI